MTENEYTMTPTLQQVRDAIGSVLAFAESGLTEEFLAVQGIDDTDVWVV
jgi:hypothetical protein